MEIDQLSMRKKSQTVGNWPEYISNKLLLFCITICWLFGCIPISLRHFYKIQPDIDSNSFGFSKNMPMFVYSFSMVLMKLAMSIRLLTYAQVVITSNDTSVIILGTITIVTWIYSDLFRRIFYITHPKLILQLFNKLHTLKTELCAINCSVHHRIVILTAVTFIFSLLVRSTEIAHGLIAMKPFTSTFEELRKLMPALIAEFLCLLIDCTSKMLSMGFIALMAHELMICYEKVMVQILKPASPCNNNCLDKFHELQECFTLYNNLAGFLILIMIAEGSTLILFNLYVLTTNFNHSASFEFPILEWIRKGRFVMELLDLGISLYLIAYIGQQFQNQVILLIIFVPTIL